MAFTDHPAPSQKWLDAGGHHSLDAPVALAFCAAATRTIRLMSYAIVLPYRNPFLVAKQIATLDRVSGGRAVLVAAVGYLRSEYAALGVDFDERNELFDEAIDVIRRAWTETNISYTGRHFTSIGQSQMPMPEGPIPIWVAGNSKRARQRAAAFGAAWAPVQYGPQQAATTRTPALQSVDELAEAIADLRRRCEDAGRDPASVEVQVESPETSVLLAQGSLGSHRAYLEGLAEIGVTSFVIDMPTSSPDDAIVAVARYGDEVVAKLS